MLTQTVSKDLTFTFTTMETLTSPIIPSNPREYFLEFSSKEEYLKKRTEWRAIYKWLSNAIRHNKRVLKSEARAFSLVEHRMVKAGKFPGYGYASSLHYHCSLGRFSKDSLEEFKSRRKVAEDKIPKPVKTGWLQATDLLEIRKLMKEESVRQRNLQLV